MENPQISIIVPVYNAERYIHKCLDSILNQTFVDWECVLVDDGSNDESGKICDEYTNKDARFKVIHKDNGGVSSARQKGLDSALGEFVIHADPDDWIETSMLEELYNKVCKSDADMVICDFFEDNGLKSSYKTQRIDDLFHLSVLEHLYTNLHGSCWNKLVRRQCIVNNNIRFHFDISYCEDLCFNTELLRNNIKVVYLNKAFYHYVKDANEDSLYKRYNRIVSDQDLRLLELLIKATEGTPAEDICKNQKTYTMVKRAFLGNIFSNEEFRLRYYRFKNIVLNERKEGMIKSIFYFLSCIGFYKPMRFLYDIISLRSK